MHIKYIIGIALFGFASSLAGCAVDTESSEPYEVEATETAQAAATEGEVCGPDGDTREDTGKDGCVYTTVTRCLWTEHISVPIDTWVSVDDAHLVRRPVRQTYITCDCTDFTTKDCPKEIESPGR